MTMPHAFECLCGWRLRTRESIAVLLPAWRAGWVRCWRCGEVPALVGLPMGKREAAALVDRLFREVARRGRRDLA